MLLLFLGVELLQVVVMVLHRCHECFFVLGMDRLDRSDKELIGRYEFLITHLRDLSGQLRYHRTVILQSVYQVGQHRFLLVTRSALKLCEIDLCLHRLAITIQLNSS